MSEKHYGTITTEGLVSVGAPNPDGGVATKYWVKKYVAENGGGGSTGGINDAPVDGKKYVRSNGNWVPETSIDTSKFATKEELADYLTIEAAAITYQVKGDYLTTVPSEYITQSELNDGLSNKADTSAISDMLTKTEASTFYATKAELGDINTILDTINGEVI